MTVLSVLDLAPIVQGGTAAEALAQSLRLAQHAESLGYERFWLAEHHNMPGVASAATAVVIGHVAGGTRRIRVGSGGIMLPNHAPLVIAEQFGTLASLYPGRIDLGQFYLRRAYRILPAAFAYIGLIWLAFQVGWIDLSLSVPTRTQDEEVAMRQARVETVALLDRIRRRA